MNERQDARAVANKLPMLEQKLPAEWLATACRSDSVSAAHPSTNRDVIPHVDRWGHCGTGFVHCTVAGRLHRYTYTWSDHVELREHHRGRYLYFLGIDGYRNGYCGCPGLSDDLQPGPIFGQSETLEMASPRCMAELNVVLRLRPGEPDDHGRCSRFYQSLRLGSSILMCRVVRNNSCQLHLPGHPVSSLPCNRCHLMDDGAKVYDRFSYLPGPALVYVEDQGVEFETKELYDTLPPF